VRATALAAAVAAGALTLMGCGGTGGLAEEGSVSQGQQLFVGEGQCASCHTLAHAGAKGAIGPDLDAAFQVLKDEDYPQSTIREVVAKQIKYPTTNPPTGAPGMPADLVEGDDVDAVASYVACAAGIDVEQAVADGCGQAAGGGGGGGDEDDPEALFTANGCGGCHILEAAGGTGEIGPNLDQSTIDEAGARKQIDEGGGGMPAFGDQLNPSQLDALAKYVVESRGG
jgi:mono/diheme cytochrome c family protein